MTDDEALAYVKATAVALALPLDEARAGRVAANLQRTSAMAHLLAQYELAPHDELAEIYCPAPFRFCSDGEDTL
jgi:hypothetical protein